MAAVDSGTLLATMAGAGATLVAIIGGLLVSRYVTLESNQEGARQRLDETRARLSAAEDNLRSATAAWERHRIEEALQTDDVEQLFVTRELARLGRQAGDDADGLEASEVTTADVQALIQVADPTRRCLRGLSGLA